MPPFKNQDSATQATNTFLSTSSMYIRDEANNIERIQELHKQLCQMHVKYNRLEQDKNDQVKRSNELEQLLNGYESNHTPQEALLCKELALADALVTIENLRRHLQELQMETAANRQEEKEQEQQRLTTQRGFRLTNLRQQSFKMQRAKSFRLVRRNSNREDGDHDEVEEVDNNGSSSSSETSNKLKLKAMQSQLKGLEKENASHAKICQSQEERILSLQVDQKSRDDKLRLTSIYTKIMQTQIEALEEERNVYAQKCQSQEMLTDSLRVAQAESKTQQPPGDPLLASLHTDMLQKQIEALEEERDNYARKCQSQQSLIDSLRVAESNIMKSQPQQQKQDPLLVTLHTNMLQTQIEAVEEERDDYARKCHSQQSLIDSLRAETDSKPSQSQPQDDPLLASLHTDMLQIQIEALEEERDNYARKCQSQQSLIDSLRAETDSKPSQSQPQDDPLLASLHTSILQTQIEAVEEERDDYARKCHSQQSLIDSLRAESHEAHYQPTHQQDDDQRMLASLHTNMLQMQIEALEEERNVYARKCQLQDSKLATLQEEKNLQNTKLEILARILESVQEAQYHAPSSNTISKEVPNTITPFSSPLKQSNSTSSCPLQSNIDKHQKTGLTTTVDIQVNGQSASYSGPTSEDDGVTKPYGTGTIKFPNGDTYYGKVAAGEMHGFGTMYSHHSRAFQRGEFQHNVFVG